MVCQVCSNELRVTSGKPVERAGKVYWSQKFTCENENCTNYHKEVRERLINVMDNTDIIEETMK